MVASAATTPPPNPALPSHDSSLPRPTVHPAGDLLPLPPAAAPHAAAELLSDLASPHHSLASVAAQHNIPLGELLAWLESPATREHIALRQSAAYTHVRYVASLNLSHAVHATIRILESFNRTPAPAPSTPAALLADPASSLCSAALSANAVVPYFRRAEQARKASWLLYRFSRLTPVSEHDLSRARTAAGSMPLGKSARRADAPAASEASSRATGGVSASANDRAPAADPASFSQTPRSSGCPTHALRDLPLSAPLCPPLPSAPPIQSPGHSASESLSLDQLLAQLTSIAGTLGIDISDLDEFPALGGTSATGPPHASRAEASHTLALAAPANTT